MPLDQLDDQPSQDVEMDLDHLEELRKRLFYAAFFVVAGGIGLFLAKDWLFDIVLFGPRHADFVTFRAWCQLSEWLGAGEALCVESINYELINTTMLGNFTTHILVSAIAGFITAFLSLRQGLLFVRPR